MTVKFLPGWAQPIESLLCQSVEPILRLAKNKWPKTRRLSVPEEKKKKKKKPLPWVACSLASQ
jgi:hypothetical protein